MPQLLPLVLLTVLALGAGVLGGVVGTGSSLILLPLLVPLYGPRTAVPVMGIAAVMANLGRVGAWWHVIRWRPVLAYALPGVPTAALGARTLLVLPPRLVETALAMFFLAMIPLRRLIARRQWQFSWWHLAIAGAGIGYLTGVVLSTGPLSVPVFTSYGLTGGPFLGTEAAAALLLYTGKLTSFGTAGVLTPTVLIRGLVIGAALLAGALLARRIVDRVKPQTYALLIDGVLIVAAIGSGISAIR